MRKLKNSSGTTLKVHAHAILINGWEYYFLSPLKGVNSADHPTGGIVDALVMGFETEIGSVSWGEIKPYLMGYSHDLSELMPPPDWEWAD